MSDLPLYLLRTGTAIYFIKRKGRSAPRCGQGLRASESYRSRALARTDVVEAFVASSRPVGSRHLLRPLPVTAFAVAFVGLLPMLLTGCSIVVLGLFGQETLVVLTGHDSSLCEIHNAGPRQILQYAFHFV